MSTLIVGPGAVGGFIASKLAESQTDITILARGARAEALRRDGLCFIGVDGASTVVAPRVRTAVELTDAADLVIVAVKASAMSDVLDDIAGAVGPETVILPLLNGIEHIDAIEARYPGQVLGGVCIVAAQLSDEGIIHQLAPGASITYGELDGSPTSKRLEVVARELAGAGFDLVASRTIVQDMWEKWLFMATGGAATVLLGGPAGTITGVAGGFEVIEALLAELTTVVAAAGHPPRAEAVARIRGALQTPESTFTTSLYRDFAQGRPTENESILGNLDRLATRLGVQHPLLSAAAVRLRVHHEARSSSESGTPEGSRTLDELTEAITEFFTNQNAAPLLSVLSDDFVLHVPRSLPYGGDFTGPAEIGAFLARVNDSANYWKSFVTTLDRVIPADGYLTVPITINATGRSSGQAMTVQNLWLFEMRDGNLCSARIYADTAAGQRAAG